MTDEHDDAPALRLVPEEPPVADDVAEDVPADADEAVEADEVGGVEPDVRDPLLARAERLAELPLAERPAAFDGLNRALVSELNQLEEG